MTTNTDARLSDAEIDALIFQYWGNIKDVSLHLQRGTARLIESAVLKKQAATVNVPEIGLGNIEAAHNICTPQPVITPAFKITDEMIDAAYRKVWSTFPHNERLPAFAREIAATLTGDKK